MKFTKIIQSKFQGNIFASQKTLRLFWSCYADDFLCLRVWTSEISLFWLSNEVQTKYHKKARLNSIANLQIKTLKFILISEYFQYNPHFISHAFILI
ncbi:MAG: hypothetical protein IJM31_02210 [Campylobacter sp.]|nr:hypothetical protein [Campylobacter sp.]